MKILWRDADFTMVSDKFQALDRVSRTYGLSPLIAAIPAQVQDMGSHKGELSRYSLSTHGFQHANHFDLGAGMKKSEYPPHRASGEVRSELKQSFETSS